MKARRRVLPRVLASLVVAIGFVWALRQGGLPLAPPPAVHVLDWWDFTAFVALTAISSFLRTSRWFYLLRPLASSLDFWRAFGVGLVGFGANFFAPLRLGEMVRPYLIAEDGEVSFAQAVGTVAAERIIDGLTIVALCLGALALSTPISPLPDSVGGLPIPVSAVPGALMFVGVAFSAAFVAMALLYVARERAQRIAFGIASMVSPRLAEAASRAIERLAQGFGFLRSPGASAPFVRDTVLYWLTAAGAYWALMASLGMSGTLPEACVAVAVVGLGSLLPAGPGFFGAFQVATYTSLAMYFHEPEVLTKGALFVFITYVAQVAVNLLGVVGGFALISRFPARAGVAAQVTAER